jgi:transposase-like protein
VNVTLKDLIRLTKELPEECFVEAYEKLKEINENAKPDADSDNSSESIGCISCGSINLYRNGKRHGKQAYLCRDCGKTFVETSGSAIAYSHTSDTVWKQVISDTVNGVSIDDTASDLDLSHDRVFHMRHKILKRLEDEALNDNAMMVGTCEADETYVLESVKGTKIPEDYHRKARRHGAKASKPGISREYLCVCSSISEDGDCMALSINRAVPSKDEISQVFGGRVNSDTLVLCDGSKTYDILEAKCTVAHTKRVNRVNGFHSFIKGQLNDYRGVATAYLNRYNALFARIFGRGDTVVDEIFALMKSRDGSFRSISDIESMDLLEI